MGPVGFDVLGQRRMKRSEIDMGLSRRLGVRVSGVPEVGVRIRREGPRDDRRDRASCVSG
jgi:hypothetical protein